MSDLVCLLIGAVLLLGVLALVAGCRKLEARK